MYLLRKKELKKALVLWYSMNLNYGDYLIFQTVKKHLELWGFSVEAMDVGLSYRAIAKNARACDVLWFAGGGIIERGIPDIIENFPDFHKRSKRIIYGVTGLSIGAFDYSEYREEIAYWIRNADFFYSRDSFTTLELNRISESDKVIDGVDVVFANDSFKRCSVKDDGRVGINLRELPYTDLSGEFRYIDWECSFKKTFSKCMVGIPDQHDCLKKMDIQFDTDYQPDSVTKLLQSVSFTVSMRFHVILVAAVMGKVSIPIVYCPKVSRLAEQLGIDELILGIHDYKKLGKIVARYLANENKYKTIMSNNVEELQQRARMMFQEVGCKLKGDI
ncbi:MAG: polysaccharide pyruvyl transferase family protein [Lachnospiraceae bacterium]|jgi:polysaccharide pyruvyl transferase WcaK-like protein|nr:polysaccharide pyruvyl transferase family protein [Lachnospiraceae bacterium]